MRRLDNRTLALLVALGFVIILILNPNGLIYTLNVIQTLVIIVLGIVATIYLWKRM
jgi:hypothetical protein